MAALTIKQGDECVIPVRITLNGAPVPIGDVEAVEFRSGDVRKTYPEDVSYDEGSQSFHMRLLQEDTFTFPEDDAVQFDVRVKFRGGAVIGGQKVTVFISVNALSETVL